MNITKKEIKNLLKNLFQILLSLFFEERLIVHSKSFVISDDSAMRDAIIRKKIYFFRSRGIWRLPPLRYPGTLFVVSGICPWQIGNYPFARILLRTKETWNKKRNS